MLKGTLLLLLGLTLFRCQADNDKLEEFTDDEYQVYGSIADTLYVGIKQGVDCLVTVDSTINYFSGRERRVSVSGGKDVVASAFAKLQFVCPSWKETDYKELENNYRTANLKRFPMIGARIKTKLKQVQLSRDSISSLITMGDWGRFYEQFPHSRGYMRFSRVGFNAKRDLALVYVDIRRESLDGVGLFVFLNKISGRWCVECNEADWVS